MSGPPPDPNGGCPYLPGSPEKVEWLERRMADGWCLWHKDDAKREDLATVETEGAASYQPTGDGEPPRGKVRLSKKVGLVVESIGIIHE
jgi:hypothetical protein